jgi:hypothetical protein
MLSWHPANRLLGLSLEIMCAIGVGEWIWSRASGPFRLLIAILVPLLLALVWVVFTPADEPGRKRRTIVPIPGWGRLLLEIVLFIFALFCFVALGQSILALALVMALLLHFFWSAERVVWLIRN